MAAPHSTPDLSVVEPEVKEPTAPSTTSASKPQAPAESPSEPSRTSRRGVPIWALLAVMAIGAVLYVTQYQRAQALDAQVTSLQGELAEVGEQLEAYQTHLGSVRTSVSALKDQIGSLDTLVNLDPLVPSVEESVELSAPLFMPAASVATPEASLASAEAARSAVVGSALATPVMEPRLEDLGPFGAPGAFQGPGF
jgi:hypothetical protein